MSIDPSRVERLWRHAIIEPGAGVRSVVVSLHDAQSTAEAVEAAGCVPVLLAERESMLGLLRAIEWRGGQGTALICPRCRCEQREGHGKGVQYRCFPQRGAAVTRSRTPPANAASRAGWERAFGAPARRRARADRRFRRDLAARLEELRREGARQAARLVR